MRIELQTNTQDDPELAFEDIATASTDAVINFRVVVRSGPFFGSQTLWIEKWVLIEFVRDLGEMNRRLTGKASLYQQWGEPGSVAFEVTELGQVSVSGELVDLPQRLEFEFATDQTCLRPLKEAFASVVGSTTPDIQG